MLGCLDSVNAGIVQVNLLKSNSHPATIIHPYPENLLQLYPVMAIIESSGKIDSRTGAFHKKRIKRLAYQPVRLLTHKHKIRN